MSTDIAHAARVAECNATVALLNNGYLRIYTGAAPDPDSVPTGTLLAEARYGNPAFGAADDDGTGQAAQAVSNAITADASADNTGDAGYFRSYQSDGATMVAQGACGGLGSGAEMELNNPHITAGAPVSISSVIYRRVQ